MILPSSRLQDQQFVSITVSTSQCSVLVQQHYIIAKAASWLLHLSLRCDYASFSARGLACMITSSVFISSLGLFFASTGTLSIASSVES